MSDPIADMLNRIINAQTVSKPIVEIPFSIVKFRIAEILNEKGFILDFIWFFDFDIFANK